ncbi:hypothetical protein [Pseudolysinimonas sp.]|uniref:hypothetical protein n=1 Tax=Pseudolysinimonas sp. TaxID=2680009 RepID=UPI003F7FB8AC
MSLASDERLFVLDPGETTGWAVFDMFWDRPLEHLAHGMQTGGIYGVVDLVKEVVPRWLPTRVIAEEFVDDGRTEHPNVEPLRVEGVLAAMWHPRPVFLQRNNYKRHAPDTMLEHLGFKWPGKGHDRDAARHAIAHAFTIGHPPTIQWVMDRLDYE